MNVYKNVADELALSHQVCRSHVKLNVDDLVVSISNQLRRLKEPVPCGVHSSPEQLPADLDALQILVRVRPPDAPARHAAPAAANAPGATDASRSTAPVVNAANAIASVPRDTAYRSIAPANAGIGPPTCENAAETLRRNSRLRVTKRANLLHFGAHWKQIGALKTRSRTE